MGKKWLFKKNYWAVLNEDDKFEGFVQERCKEDAVIEARRINKTYKVVNYVIGK